MSEDKVVIMSEVPEIGKKYHFFDDGKMSPSRHYIAEVLEVITNKKAKSIQVSDNKNLYQAWKEEIENHTSYSGNIHGKGPGEPWLYADSTDYFIKCSIPKYDEKPVWFARDIWGGWFSMDIYNFWQSGRLDIDCDIFKQWETEFPEEYLENKLDYEK